MMTRRGILAALAGACGLPSILTKEGECRDCGTKLSESFTVQATKEGDFLARHLRLWSCSCCGRVSVRDYRP